MLGCYIFKVHGSTCSALYSIKMMTINLKWINIKTWISDFQISFLGRYSSLEQTLVNHWNLLFSVKLQYIWHSSIPLTLTLFSQAFLYEFTFYFFFFSLSFAYMFFLSSAVGVSFDSCANTYCGKSAGSEPEAKAVMGFVGECLSISIKTTLKTKQNEKVS